MRSFGRAVRKAEPALRLPVDRRTRVLLEVRQDLEDLYAAYCARGVAPWEARRRALEMLGLGDEAAASLTALHAPWWASLLDRFSALGSAGGERMLLGGLAGLAVVIGCVALRASDVWRASPVVSASVIGALCVAAAWMGATWLRLVRRDGTGASAYATLPIAGLAVFSGATGLLGAVIELHELARVVERTGGWDARSAVVKLADASMLVTFGLSAMLLILLVWLPLHRAARRFEAEHVLLHRWPGGTERSDFIQEGRRR